MKAIIKIDLDDTARSLLADVIDNKITKRLATRADVVKVCQLHVAGLIHRASMPADARTPGPVVSWNSPDVEDLALLAGKPEGYIYGWNKAKHS